MSHSIYEQNEAVFVLSPFVLKRSNKIFLFASETPKQSTSVANKLILKSQIKCFL